MTVFATIFRVWSACYNLPEWRLWVIRWRKPADSAVERHPCSERCAFYQTDGSWQKKIKHIVNPNFITIICSTLISSRAKLVEDYSFPCDWPKGDLSIANSMMKFSQFTNVSLNFAWSDGPSSLCCPVLFNVIERFSIECRKPKPK